MRDALLPGRGLLLIALVWPFQPYVELSPSGDHQPQERLPIAGHTFEQQVNLFASNVRDDQLQQPGPFLFKSFNRTALETADQVLTTVLTSKRCGLPSSRASLVSYWVLSFLISSCSSRADPIVSINANLRCIRSSESSDSNSNWLSSTKTHFLGLLCKDFQTAIFLIGYSK